MDGHNTLLAAIHDALAFVEGAESTPDRLTLAASLREAIAIAEGLHKAMPKIAIEDMGESNMRRCLLCRQWWNTGDPPKHVPGCFAAPT